MDVSKKRWPLGSKHDDSRMDWQICDQFEAEFMGVASRPSLEDGLRCIRQERLIDQLKQVETSSQDRAGGPWWAMV
jgi:hypothetical protein